MACRQRERLPGFFDDEEGTTVAAVRLSKHPLFDLFADCTRDVSESRSDFSAPRSGVSIYGFPHLALGSVSGPQRTSEVEFELEVSDATLLFRLAAEPSGGISSVATLVGFRVLKLSNRSGTLPTAPIHHLLRRGHILHRTIHHRLLPTNRGSGPQIFFDAPLFEHSVVKSVGPVGLLSVDLGTEVGCFIIIRFPYFCT